MRRRQTMPRQWLIIADPSDRDAVAAAFRLPRGSGILLLQPLSGREMRRLRQSARNRGLTIAKEQRRAAARVHNARELRRALLARTPLILLSPLYPTSSHPDRKPIPRMRAAALARLGGRKLVALGGMDARKYARIKRLGFQRWAGISAFRT
ncbi:MAG TPA: thiamine phosphate synthase [Sphingomicrobium sp.]|nr:thiamine phosphate synthase [Sphingomicrobium sp.]